MKVDFKKIKLAGCLLSAFVISAQPVFAGDRAAAEQAMADAAATAAAATDLNRSAAIANILANTGASGNSQLEGALNAASNEALLAAGSATSVAEVTNVLSPGAVSANADLSSPAKIGDVTDLLYVPVAPCRIVDTRVAGGMFAPQTTREYYVYGPSTDIAPQGGSPTGCPAPQGEPRAVQINVTAVTPLANGHFRVYPANLLTPNAAVMSYGPIGVNLSNAASFRTYFSFGPKEIEVYSWAATHLVVDVMGYYYDVNMPNDVAETRHAGYDWGGGLVNSTTISMIPNTAVAMSLQGDESVLISGGASVYKNDVAAGTNISGTMMPCYQIGAGTPVAIGGFTGQTDFCAISTGVADMHTVRTSVKTSLAAGAYTFGICVYKGNDTCGNTGVNFSTRSPKIEIIKVDN